MNSSINSLYENAIKDFNSRISSTGALVSYSGSKTGRSPKDKRFAMNNKSNDIWWGDVNMPIDQDFYTKCLDLAKSYIEPHTVNTITSKINPASTGIWNKDGTFNKEIFDKLTKNFILLGDKKIITKQMFWDHLEERHKGQQLGNACHVYMFIPVSWRKVTEGSINDLFKYFSDTTYKNEPAFTIDRLFEFYTNPNKCMNERVKNNSLK
ncbi:unnamed protein product [marine sediment metagenome]|uniref:Phosphoenolpyruvate carboxykinase (ATP) n=1 Tax=marine sediment metagenome TaxID=412755 RepID=X0ZRN9_9ZZZZ